MSAVEDALTQLGVAEQLELPVTPSKLWTAIQHARRPAAVE
jgi:hypothetical protein